MFCLARGVCLSVFLLFAFFFLFSLRALCLCFSLSLHRLTLEEKLAQKKLARLEAKEKDKESAKNLKRDQQVHRNSARVMGSTRVMGRARVGLVLLLILLLVFAVFYCSLSLSIMYFDVFSFELDLIIMLSFLTS
jgi:uncharacterized integral membrane protein